MICSRQVGVRIEDGTTKEKAAGVAPARPPRRSASSRSVVTRQVFRYTGPAPEQADAISCSDTHFGTCIVSLAVRSCASKNSAADATKEEQTMRRAADDLDKFALYASLKNMKF